MNWLLDSRSGVVPGREISSLKEDVAKSQLCSYDSIDLDFPS